MNNEDIVSLMERYKRELMEFDKRNTAPVSAKAEAKAEPVSTDGEAVSVSAQSDDAVSTAATVQQSTPQETEITPADEAESEKTQFIPERDGVSDIPQPRTAFAAPEQLKNGTPRANNSSSAMQKYNNFKGEYRQHGWLRVETYSSNGLYPVSNSRVVVYKEIDGENYFIYDLHTDSSGIVDSLELPAPSKNLSETQQPSSGPAPYATYSIFVSHPGFVSTYFENVPIFDSTVSIQAVEMLPKVSGEADTNTIDESV